MNRTLLLVLTVVVSACGLADRDLGVEDGDLTSVGPHATRSSVRIVYPETAPALGLAYDGVADRWEAGAANLESVPLLELTEGDMAVAESPASGVAVDVVAPDGVVEVAQLSVVDGAGDDEDADNVAALLAFLEAVQLDADAVIEALGVNLAELHADDQDVEAIYRGDAATVFYAANEDTVLVGVFGGPWNQ